MTTAQRFKYPIQLFQKHQTSIPNFLCNPNQSPIRNSNPQLDPYIKSKKTELKVKYFAASPLSFSDNSDRLTVFQKLAELDSILRTSEKANSQREGEGREGERERRSAESIDLMSRICRIYDWMTDGGSSDSIEPEKPPEVPGGGVVDRGELLLREGRERKGARLRGDEERRTGVHIGPAARHRRPELRCPDLPRHRLDYLLPQTRLVNELRIERFTSPKDCHLLHHEAAPADRPEVVWAGSLGDRRRRRGPPPPIRFFGPCSLLLPVRSRIRIGIPVCTAPPARENSLRDSDLLVQATLRSQYLGPHVSVPKSVTNQTSRRRRRDKESLRNELRIPARYQDSPA